jgi:hypothetical protein
MVNEKLIIPKENIYKTEEIIVLDRNENYQPNKFLNLIMSTAHCMDDDQKEGGKNVVSGAVIGSGAAVGTGTLNPATGAAAATTLGGAMKALGKIEKGIGEMIGDESVKAMGEIKDEGSTKALEKVGEKITGN